MTGDGRPTRPTGASRMATSFSWSPRAWPEAGIRRVGA